MILQGIEHLISWTSMAFNPAKSQSLVLKRRKVTDKLCFSLGGAQIALISEKSVKSLGKMFDSTLKDNVATGSELGTWLTTLNKSTCQVN